MGWDASRPVDWNRLLREALIYAAIVALILAIANRGQSLVSIGLPAMLSIPLYMGFGYVLAKFGVQRGRRSKQASEAHDNAPTRSGKSTAASGTRPKPAPTKRTGGGTPNRPTKRRR